ncbi:MAG: T9SS type A sorting domain-containing protein [Bacteroidia bacterium]|nr:T9SS type A sorting domain-containing protein [Bacteroidia bacterium]
MRQAPIILFIALLLTCSANAQTLLLRDTSGNPVSNGDTILVTGTTDDGILLGYVEIYNSSSATISLLVEKQHLSLVFGSDAYIGWNCVYPPQIFLSPDTVSLPAASTMNGFVGWLATQGFAGTSFVRYKFFDANNIADSAWVVFQYNVLQAAGIAQLNGSDAFNIYPNPGNGVFSFYLPTSFQNNVSMEVLTAQGTVLRKRNFSSPASVSIDMTGDAAGIYFVKLSDGEKTVVKKFVKQ